MKLNDLLATAASGFTFPADHPALALEVNSIKTNSLACQPGDLFIGLPGTRVDGGDFWSGAFTSGAIAALVSPAAYAKTQPSASAESPLVIAVEDVVTVCAQLASAFYRHPTQQLKMVGVTGTNGKTTTTHIIEYLLNGNQQPTALLGTLYTRWPGYEKVASHTTPFAVDLQAQLAEAVDAGCQVAVMEVSSHALAQRRVLGCEFDVAVFTNLTQDHLDYHKDMEDYFAAKALLFGPAYLRGRAILNLDDAYGQRLKAEAGGQVWCYSKTNPEADLWAEDLTYGSDGIQGILHTPQGNRPFSAPLVGQYNLENLLAAVGTVLQLGLDLDVVIAQLAVFPGVPGRMEQVKIASMQDIGVVVDYAHTPDSLENLLKAARPFAQGKLICVFGCGGDRDRSKRPLMGGIGARLADLAIVTSDNPRTEDPAQILQDVVAGIPSESAYVVIADRAEAIRRAILEAQPGDSVLIAGKGHEDYQILGTEKIHFDDREQARLALSDRLGISL